MDNLDEILPHISKNSYAIFLGAGISKLAGCGLWYKLRDDLLNHTLVNKEKNKILKNIDSLEEQIEYCYNKFKDSKIKIQYINIVRKIITMDVELFKSSYLPFINKIKDISPFTKLIITTNIDNCLENTKLFSSYNCLYKAFDIVQADFDKENLLHLHGMIEDIDHVLLVYSLIKKRYSWSRFKKLMSILVNKHSILFLGYGLRDKELLECFRKTKLTHFALISSDGDKFDDFKISYYLQTYHIKIIKYGKRKDLPFLLASWIDKHFSKLKLSDSTQNNDSDKFI